MTMNQVIADQIEELWNSIANIESALEKVLENTIEDITGLYVPPLSPQEEYDKELKELKEAMEDEPVPLETIYQEGIDIETLAFFSISDEARQRLTN